MTAVALVLLALGGFAFLVRAVLGPSLADRLVAVDGLVVTIFMIVVVRSIRHGSDLDLDVALIVAFVGFLSTTAGARFVERRGG